MIPEETDSEQLYRMESSIRQELARIQEAYRMEAQPWIDRLVKIEAMRSHRLVLNGRLDELLDHVVKAMAENQRAIRTDENGNQLA